MSAGGHHAHACHQLHLALHLGQLASGSHDVELLGLHDPRQAQLVAVGGVCLVALDDVAGPLKVGPALGIDHAAGVVVVQVAHDHEVDRRRILPQRAERNRRVATLDPLDLPILVTHARPGSGLDQDPLPARLDK